MDFSSFCYAESLHTVFISVARKEGAVSPAFSKEADTTVLDRSNPLLESQRDLNSDEQNQGSQGNLRTEYREPATNTSLPVLFRKTWSCPALWSKWLNLYQCFRVARLCSPIGLIIKNMATCVLPTVCVLG